MVDDLVEDLVADLVAEEATVRAEQNVLPTDFAMMMQTVKLKLQHSAKLKTNA